MSVYEKNGFAKVSKDLCLNSKQNRKVNRIITYSCKTCKNFYMLIPYTIFLQIASY